MINLSALALAPAAQTWLAQTTTARVLNVFDRACNLVNTEGDVLAVVTSEHGLTPFALVVASIDRAPFRVISETSHVWVQRQRLSLGPFEIDASWARVWNPMPEWHAIQCLFTDAARLDELAVLAFGRGPAGSLLELFDPAEQAGSLPAVLRSRAHQGAQDLVAGMRTGSIEIAIAGVQRLAGLGGGLTPAGDDFVLGVLLAAWAGLYGNGAENWGMSIAEATASRTTTLSAAYLRAAARGECSAYWHGLFEALSRPEAGGLRAALAALLSVGHTSGADALAGFLAARLAAPSLPAGPRLTSTGG
jgi:hypothetical protein